jgi:hypothetical protein
VKRDHQQKSLSMTKDEPGFGWYKRACCESTCGECGIDSRLAKTTIPNDDTSGAALLSSLAAVHSPCDCEFRCLNDSGAEINVGINESYEVTIWFYTGSEFKFRYNTSR